MSDIWLLQSNIWQEYAYDRFVSSLIAEGDVDLAMVDVIPFTEDFKTPVDFIPRHVFGSNRFVEICRSKGFPTFKSFAPYEEFYDNKHWLNSSGKDMCWGDLKHITTSGPLFIKPYREKFFTGMVLETLSDLNKVQLATSFVENVDDELVRVSKAQTIYTEVRFYIINGQPITASVYKESGRGKQYELPDCSPAWNACRNILQEGAIDKAFVMDLGLTSKDDSYTNWKIVELNNINSSGLYKANTDALIKAFKNI